ALWSAAHYRVGVLFVVLSNGGYAIMDRLAERQEREPPWPGFDVDVAAIARAFGCAGRRITAHYELVRELDEIVASLAGRAQAGHAPSLAARTAPARPHVVLAPTRTFAP